MKVFVAPPSHLSQAMFRVARALTRYAPDGVEIVTDPNQANLQVLHVIGLDAIPYVDAKPDLNYAVVQYCLKAVQAPVGNNMVVVDGDWSSLWDRAKTVWSYYDVDSKNANFYHAPLGIDPAFTRPIVAQSRDVGIVTSGYVAGRGAEAIEEVANAGSRLNMSVVHLGPQPTGLTARPKGDWRNVQGISDSQLATLYRSSKWVSGLRHIEGFELPVVEGLACGARPIVFDRLDMRHWYNGHAMFVPESEGEELVDHLMAVMNGEPTPVSDTERKEVLRRFDWKPIVEGFWERVL